MNERAGREPPEDNGGTAQRKIQVTLRFVNGERAPHCAVRPLCIHHLHARVITPSHPHARSEAWRGHDLVGDRARSFEIAGVGADGAWDLTTQKSMAKKKIRVSRVAAQHGGAVPVPATQHPAKPNPGDGESSAASQGHSVVNYSKWDVMASALSDDEDGPPPPDGTSADSE
jgi:hypothetical protein